MRSPNVSSRGVVASIILTGMLALPATVRANGTSSDTTKPIAKELEGPIEEIAPAFSRSLGAQVERAIRDRLGADRAAGVTVGNRLGVVDLGGSVRTLADRELAGAAVDGVAGVRKLEVHLAVKPSRAVGDDELRASVSDALQRLQADRRGGRFEATVGAGGRVSLAGSASDAASRERVVAAISGIEGVTSLDDTITLAPMR